MDYQAFAERTKGKSFDELVHQGKYKAQRLLEDQGIVALSLYISELLVRSLETARTERTLPKEVTEEVVYDLSGNL